MKRLSGVRFALLFVLGMLASAGAHALLFRAYVASDGSDANPCTLPQPCRLLPAALAAVESGGEIWMLDSANYNTSMVTIAKSVSILAIPGAVGSLLTTGGSPAIFIDTHGIKVSLRNVVIVPLLGAGTYGIHVVGAATVFLEDSLIAGTNNNAIFMVNEGALRVSNTTIRGVLVGYAISIGDGVEATVVNSRLLDNQDAVYASSASPTQHTRMTISDSVIARAGIAVAVQAFAGSAAIQVTRTTIELCTIALAANSGGGTQWISASGNMIVNCTQGWEITGGGATIRSLGNNHFEFSGVNVGSLTTLSPL